MGIPLVTNRNVSEIANLYFISLDNWANFSIYYKNLLVITVDSLQHASNASFRHVTVTTVD